MITWSTGHIQFMSPHCNAHCLPQPHDVFAKTTNVSINTSDIGIPVIRKSPEAQLPTCGSKESTSWDLYSIKEVTIQPGHQALVNTSISIQLPENTYGHIAPHSGLAWKQGLATGAGVIDQDYTGEIKVLLFNHGNTTVTLNSGGHIAQLIPETYNSEPLKEVNQINDTERGAEGFGSTGIEYMEPDQIEIYAIDVAVNITKETIKEILPEPYHAYVELADPTGPLQELPPLRPGYDFEIKLDPTKPLLKPARLYHMHPEEKQDWRTWRDVMTHTGHIS